MTRRILTAMLAVTILSVTAFFVPAAVAIDRSEERGELLELQREASIVAGRVPPFGPIDDSILQPIIDSEHRLGLYDRDGTRLGGVGPERADALVAVGIRGTFAEGYVGGDLVAVVPLRIQPDGSSLAMRIEAPRPTVADSFLALGAIALGIIMIAAAVAVWLARRLNRPIEQLRSWASTGPDEQGAPPDATGIGEVDGLRLALLDSRARIDDLLRRERSFSSHVSHQLRTPVAAMRVAIETELASPRSDSRAVLEESLGQLDRLESLITSLLALGRRTDPAVVECDLAELAAERTGAWRGAFGLAARGLHLAPGPVSGRVDPAAFGHILDVLLDNALRHGTGPVTVTVARVDDLVTVDVADAGPAPTAHDPFTEARTDSSHGIGLRLARTLAESAGWRLTLLDAPTTTFRLTVPAVA